MSSEYMEQDSDLALNGDGSYKKASMLFGSHHVELGTWRVDDSTLVLMRNKYIKNKKEKASSQTFKLQITSNTNNRLILKNKKSTTTCKK